MLNYFALIMQKTIQSNLDAYYSQYGINSLYDSSIPHLWKYNSPNREIGYLVVSNNEVIKISISPDFNMTFISRTLIGLVGNPTTHFLLASLLG